MIVGEGKLSSGRGFLPLWVGTLVEPARCSTVREGKYLFVLSVSPLWV